MPLFKKNKPVIIGLSFTDEAFTCSMIEENFQTKQYVLTAYQQYDINYISSSPYLTPLSRIAHHIKNFCASLTSYHVYAAISLQSPQLHEKIFYQEPTIQDPHAIYTQLQLSISPYRLYQGYIQHIYLFQHQLLALQTSLRYLAIIPHTLVYIKALNLFSKKIVCDDIAHIHAIINQHIGSFTIESVCQASATKKEYLTALGLFFIGKEYYEFNQSY